MKKKMEHDEGREMAVEMLIDMHESGPSYRVGKIIVSFSFMVNFGWIEWNDHDWWSSAINPDDRNALYFVLLGDQGHRTNETLHKFDTK